MDALVHGAVEDRAGVDAVAHASIRIGQLHEVLQDPRHRFRSRSNIAIGTKPLPGSSHAVPC